MADPAQMLQQLRPLHSPPGLEATLPLLGLALAGALLALLLWPWLARRGAVRRAALAGLARTRTYPPAERAMAQAALLRKVAAGLGVSQAERLDGEAWLTRLDSLLGTQFFSKGEGRWFGEGLYRPSRHPDPAALDHALQRLFGSIGR